MNKQVNIFIQQNDTYCLSIMKIIYPGKITLLANSVLVKSKTYFFHQNDIRMFTDNIYSVKIIKNI